MKLEISYPPMAVCEDRLLACLFLSEKKGEKIKEKSENFYPAGRVFFPQSFICRRKKKSRFKKAANLSLLPKKQWCPGRDSNPHAR